MRTCVIDFNYAQINLIWKYDLFQIKLSFSQKKQHSQKQFSKLLVDEALRLCVCVLVFVCLYVWLCVCVCVREAA